MGVKGGSPNFLFLRMLQMFGICFFFGDPRCARWVIILVYGAGLRDSDKASRVITYSLRTGFAGNRCCTPGGFCVRPPTAFPCFS